MGAISSVVGVIRDLENNYQDPLESQIAVDERSSTHCESGWCSGMKRIPDSSAVEVAVASRGSPQSP